MQKFLILFFFSKFIFFGCSSNHENFKTYYNKEYIVSDRGGNNVSVISKACSIFPDRANSEALRSAKYHLRSVIGSQNFRKKFKKIRTYNSGRKICIEILGEGSNSL